MKKGLLPRLAVNGIRKNSSTYLPYIGVSIFAVFTYFVFDIILKSDIPKTVPKADYALTLMSIGFGLLSLIMIPFLYYTNSFLIKRRKRELGLYSILGLEKKHIGMVMALETLILYVIITAAALVLGALFSKLIFLSLLNLAKLPVDAPLNFNMQAVKDTIIFYAVISGINLFTNLVQVGKTNAIQLLGETRKGEKEPKHIWLWTVLGLLCLGWGYHLALRAKLDSMIFMNFFLAVFLVVAGTHCLFTSGSIFLLRRLKKNKRFYFRPENFITVSGMLYRMKKNAASLVNICIFATMAIITVVCTVSLYLGIPGIQDFTYPYDIEMNFSREAFAPDASGPAAFRAEAERLAEQSGVKVTAYHEYPYTLIPVTRKGQDEKLSVRDGSEEFADQYSVKLMTLAAFNALEGSSYALEDGEALLYSTGPDFGLGQVRLGEQMYRIREELQESSLEPKAANNEFGGSYAIILKDGESLARAAAYYGVDSLTSETWRVELDADGEKEQKQAFADALNQTASGTVGFLNYRYMEQSREEMEAMCGGLLFIGIFYGLIFLICLLIIMYYKQITEGFEDQKSFEIMQEVGMSDTEVKRTIKKQVRLVFFLPLLGAVCHTAVGMNMVIKLMGAISLFQTGLILCSALGVCLLFSLLYWICYNRTARTYYRIVKRMA